MRAAWVEGKSQGESIEIGKACGLKALELHIRERLRSNPASDTSRQCVRAGITRNPRLVVSTVAFPVHSMRLLQPLSGLPVQPY